MLLHIRTFTEYNVICVVFLSQQHTGHHWSYMMGHGSLLK